MPHWNMYGIRDQGYKSTLTQYAGEQTTRRKLLMFVYTPINTFPSI